MASTISFSQRRSTSVTTSLGAFSTISPTFSARESWSSPARRAMSHAKSCTSIESFMPSSLPGFAWRFSARPHPAAQTCRPPAPRRGGPGAEDELLRLAEVLAQVLGAALLAQEVKGLHLDLAHPLARNVELAADLFERARPVVLHPEPQFDDLALPLGQLVERLAQVGLQQRLGDGVRRGNGARVFEEVAELGGVVVANRGGEAYGPLAYLLQPLYLLDKDAELARYLLLGGLAAEALHHAPVRAVVLVYLLYHVHRDADGAALVGDRAGDSLPDPPRRVGRELKALGRVELLRSPYQAEVAFLDQVEERDPAVPVLLGDGDDEPQVRLDEPVLAPLAAAGYAVGKPYLVGVVEERHAPDLGQVHPYRVARRDGVGDLGRGRLGDLHGGGLRAVLGRLGDLARDEGYLLFLERRVELLYLGGREIPLLHETGDFLRTEEPLTSPPIQKLVGSLSQHHGVLDRH